MVLAMAWMPPLAKEEGLRWLSLDLHVHSTYSGGSLRPAEIVQSCCKLLLDGVAISDHNEVQGSLEGVGLVEKDSHLPVVLTSQEISAGDHFHILLIGSTQRQPDPGRGELLEVIRRHRASGGAVVWAHPWTLPQRRWAKECLREMLAEDLLDAVELCNGSLAELNGNIGRILEEIWQEWVCPYQLGVTGGSDYHYIHRGRVMGAGRTYVRVAAPTPSAIIGAIRSRKTIGGIFQLRTLDLGWLGKGHRFMVGLKPWVDELEQFIAGVSNEIGLIESIQPFYGRYLRNLTEAGHFQMAYDWLRMSGRQ